LNIYLYRLKKRREKMNIKILGTGCPNCIRLEKNVIKALKMLEIEASIEKVTEISDILSYGVMSTPALVVNEKVLFYGRVPSSEIIKEYL